MSLSLGELQAITAKAVRGAGFSWSMAEEAAYAVYWLEARGIAGTNALADYLTWVDKHEPIEPSIDLLEASPQSSVLRCPLHLGCYVVDTAMYSSATTFTTKQPLLLVPFLARTAKTNVIVLRCNAIEYHVSAVGINKTAIENLLIDETTVSWSIASGDKIESDCTTRATVDKLVLNVLQSFAGKTYAPASQTSRLIGAGAGTTDND